MFKTIETIKELRKQNDKLHKEIKKQKRELQKARNEQREMEKLSNICRYPDKKVERIRQIIGEEIKRTAVEILEKYKRVTDIDFIFEYTIESKTPEQKQLEELKIWWPPMEY